MEFTQIQKTLKATHYMLQARATLKEMHRDGYLSVVKGWIDAIREHRTRTGQSPVEILCRMIENERNEWLQLAMLAATLEIIEEDARISGVTIKEA